MPLHIQFAAYVVIINMFVFTVFRLVFWAAFHVAAPFTKRSDLAEAFYLGSRFDLRLALLLVSPIMLLLWIPALDFARSRIVRIILLVYLVMVEFICIFIYLVDFGYYAWEHSRITIAVIGHFFADSRVSSQMVLKAYPVSRAFAGIILYLAIFTSALYAIISRLSRKSAPRTSRKAKAFFYALTSLLYLFGLYGRLALLPLQWNQAFFSIDYFLSALASNPVHYFVDTWRIRAKDVDLNEVRKHYGEVADYLGVQSPDQDKLSFTRRYRPKGITPKNTNVIIIILESFSAVKTGVFGNRLNATPCFDDIAAHSTLFKSFFVAAKPTARAIFSLITGIPDVDSGGNATEDPRAVKQRTIITDFEGYDKLYFYTGDLNWANIKGVLTHNIPGLRLFEEGQYASPRNDMWGISDFDLFEEANQVLRGCEAKPFIAIIHTSGDHSPFTIPSHKGNFQMRALDDKTILENGFEYPEEFNATRFIDYSLGHYFQIARREKYFSRTVFLIFGDHGSHPAANYPWERLNVASSHVPFVIYGPGLVPEGKVVEDMVSSIDVLPTAAGIVGIPYTNTALGRDMFDAPLHNNEFAFLGDIGLLSNEFCLIHSEDGSFHLYRYRSENPLEEVGDKYKDQEERMSRLFNGINETARYLLYNNHD